MDTPLLPPPGDKGKSGVREKKKKIIILSWKKINVCFKKDVGDSLSTLRKLAIALSVGGGTAN